MTNYPPIVDNIITAISAVETRGYGAEGKYKAIGKPNKKGQKAYGAWQVMDFNVPVWTKEVLGKSMTPKEFLNDPAAQIAVARQKIGNLYLKHGNINDVASVWFSGQPFSKASEDLKDVTGTSTRAYVTAVNAKMPSLPKTPQTATVVSSALRNAFNNLFGVNPNLQYKREEPNQTPTKAPSSPVSMFPGLGNIGRITTPFGAPTRQEKSHPGIDIAAPLGTKFPSPVNGVVSNVDMGHPNGENSFGNQVQITDSNGDNHRFSHLNNAYVKVGQPVNKGTPVGEIGSSGAAYSPSGSDPSNLDWRITTAYGKAKNPMLYLRDTKLG